jgi:hypothetical protein
MRLTTRLHVRVTRFDEYAVALIAAAVIWLKL